MATPVVMEPLLGYHPVSYTHLLLPDCVAENVVDSNVALTVMKINTGGYET